MNLKRALLQRPLVTTHDELRARRSRLIWGERPGPEWVLTPLGLANTVRRALGRPPWAITAATPAYYVAAVAELPADGQLLLLAGFEPILRLADGREFTLWRWYQSRCLWCGGTPDRCPGATLAGPCEHPPEAGHEVSGLHAIWRDE